MTKVTRVIKRDSHSRPLLVAVSEETSRYEVVGERTIAGWKAIHGVRIDTGKEVALPRGFEFNRDALQALDRVA